MGAGAGHWTIKLPSCRNTFGSCAEAVISEDLVPLPWGCFPDPWGAEVGSLLRPAGPGDALYSESSKSSTSGWQAQGSPFYGRRSPGRRGKGTGSRLLSGPSRRQGQTLDAPSQAFMGDWALVISVPPHTYHSAQLLINAYQVAPQSSNIPLAPQSSRRPLWAPHPVPHATRALPTPTPGSACALGWTAHSRFWAW